jgi:hypothetical protein
MHGVCLLSGAYWSSIALASSMCASALSMQNSTEPSFWDELSAKVVVKNRKVFQHPSCFVELGHSPTAQHVQQYWLNDCVSIIATNRWFEDLQQIRSQQDQRWLGQNSIVLSVDSPMFLSV